MSTISDDKKRRFIIDSIPVFFDDFDKKIRYLEELYNDGHRDEARVLCACYIDYIASGLYWPVEQNNVNYVKVLKEHGGKEIFSYIHPKMLDKELHKLAKKRRKKWAIIYAKVSPGLQGALGRLYGEPETINLLATLLSASELENTKREIWRGTFAAIVYDRFRNPAVHEFGPPGGITFDNTTFQGQPVPEIDFFMIHDCLKKIVGVAREISIKTGRFFGHNYN
jgi:hypothetical protein